MFCSCNDSTSGHQSHDEPKLKQCSGIALTLSFLISSAVFLPLMGRDISVIRVKECVYVLWVSW